MFGFRILGWFGAQDTVRSRALVRACTKLRVRFESFQARRIRQVVNKTCRYERRYYGGDTCTIKGSEKHSKYHGIIITSSFVHSFIKSKEKSRGRLGLNSYQNLSGKVSSLLGAGEKTHATKQLLLKHLSWHHQPRRPGLV